MSKTNNLLIGRCTFREHLQSFNSMEGYAKIARLMSDDTGLAIFRRFGELNMQHLLYLQAELAELENELDELSRLEYSQTHDPFRHSFARSWCALKSSSEEEGAAGQQWEQVLEIQRKMRKYCTSVSIILQGNLTNMI